MRSKRCAVQNQGITLRVGCTPVLPMVNRHRLKEAVFLSFNEFVATDCHDIPLSQS